MSEIPEHIARSQTAARLEAKTRNLENNAQKKRERECFWTLPFGHIRELRSTQEFPARTSDGIKPVKVLISKCLCCGHERRYVVDNSRQLRLELKKWAWNFKFQN